jgi:colanic acid/amylovoran biosynthesis glycosyltransferase
MNHRDVPERDRIRVIQSVSKWLPQTATWLHNQVRFLPANVESHIVCEATQNLDQFPQPHVHALAAEPLRRSLWDRGLRRFGVRPHLEFLIDCVRAVGADLVHSHFGDYGWRNSAAVERAGLRHIVTFYGIDVTFIPRSDERWPARYRDMFARVDRVLCEGPFMARSIAALGCPEDKIDVHHLGIDLDRIPFEPRRWSPGETLCVLMAGSFREKKGFPYAIRALGRIQGDVDLQVTIIGDAHDERTRLEKRAILAAIDANGLAAKTRLPGYLPYDDVLAEARRHHVFLSPSVTGSDGDTEGGAPVSIIEMGASGMMVVSTTHCDIPGVVLDGVTGRLAAERDVDGLVRHLRWLVEHPDEWPAMLVAGRRHVETEFDARVQGERLAGVYRRVCGRH